MGGFGVWGTTGSATSAPGGGLSDLHAVELADDCMSWTITGHGHPQAVWDPETARDWVVFLKAGGDLYATYYDHSTGEVAVPVLVAVYPFGAADFHHVPTLMMDADGRLHIIWAGHNDAHRHYRSDSPRDLSAWTVQSLDVGSLAFSATTDDGELIVTDRPGSAHGASFPAHEYGAMHRSTDGSTFTRTEIVDTTGSPEAASDFYQLDLLYANDQLQALWTIARGAGHNGDRSDIHYAACDLTTGIWSAADGTALGTSITWAEHTTALALSRAHDTLNPRATLTWHMGRPVIAAYVEASGADTAELVVIEWDGSAWQTSDVLTTATFSIQPVLVSTPDELMLLVRSNDDHDVEQWRLIDGSWENVGLLLRDDGTDAYGHLTPIRGGGPGLALANKYDRSGGNPGSADNVVGPLTLITRRFDASGADVDHSHDYAASDHTHAGAGETIFAPDYTVTDGSTLDLTVTFLWGIDASGDPYYNAAGVTAGEEAVLVLDNATGEFSLRPVEV